MPMMPKNWLLDASCALNLAASGHIEPILRTPFAGQPKQFFLSEAVLRESGFLRRSAADEREQEQIIWQVHFDSDLLQRTTLNPNNVQEVEYSVGLAVEELGEGETECLAIALSRGWGVAIDDTDARKVALKYKGDFPLLATPDLIKNWVDRTHPNASALGTMLKQIRERARYGPPRNHPLREWWIDALNVAP